MIANQYVKRSFIVRQSPILYYALSPGPWRSLISGGMLFHVSTDIARRDSGDSTTYRNWGIMSFRQVGQLLVW